jgi:hypothetical protein
MKDKVEIIETALSQYPQFKAKFVRFLEFLDRSISNNDFFEQFQTIDSKIDNFTILIFDARIVISLSIVNCQDDIFGKIDFDQIIHEDDYYNIWSVVINSDGAFKEKSDDPKWLFTLQSLEGIKHIIIEVLDRLLRHNS